MSSIKDITLGEFSNLSYIDLPRDLEIDLDSGREIPLKEFADRCMEQIEAIEDPLRKQEIQDVVSKCQNGEYKDYKIVYYDNDNGKSGFVGYAIETNTGELIIASRGSELPDEKQDRSWEDWTDNVEMSIEYETIQQGVARKFVNEIGSEYNSIYLTGHSKGGNNVLYATITADESVRSKIKNCVTFNAPGFGDKFIKDSKYVIDQLNKAGVFKEYQGSGDFVSSIMNNVSDPIIIKQKDLNKNFFEKLKGFDDHYIYAMEIDGDTFVSEEDGEKELLPVFVNNLVAGLTFTLTDKEIDEIIDLVNNILNKDEGADILDIGKMLLDSGVDPSTVKVIFLQAISEASMIFIKESPIVPIKGIGYVVDFYFDTKTFIYANISRIKNYVRDAIFKLGKNILKVGIKSVKNIMNMGFKVSIGRSSGNMPLIIPNLIGSRINSNKCLVRIDDINTALRTYKVELTNIRGNLRKFDSAMNKLVKSGWGGQASRIFYSVKFIRYKASMGTIESQLSYMVSYLEKAKRDFERVKLEEDALVAVLA